MPIGTRMRINDRDMDYFCGTSYYALHGNPVVIEAARRSRRILHWPRDAGAGAGV